MAEVAPPAPVETESPLVELRATTPLLPPESRPGMRGVEDWFCTGRLRAASEDHRTSWKVFMAEVPGKLEGVKVLMEQVCSNRPPAGWAGWLTGGACRLLYRCPAKCVGRHSRPGMWSAATQLTLARASAQFCSG